MNDFEDDSKQNGKYGVGYGKPPKRAQFAKGRSGNPRGRPKGSKLRFDRVGDEFFRQKLTVVVEGKPRKLPLGEALQLVLAQQAVKGDVPALKEILKMADKASARTIAVQDRVEPITRIERVIVNPKECNVALSLLGIVESLEGNWRIANWAVEASVARKSNLKLREGDCALIRNSSVDRGLASTLLSRKIDKPCIEGSTGAEASTS